MVQRFTVEEQRMLEEILEERAVAQKFQGYPQLFINENVGCRDQQVPICYKRQS